MYTPLMKVLTLNCCPAVMTNSKGRPAKSSSCAGEPMLDRGDPEAQQIQNEREAVIKTKETSIR